MLCWITIGARPAQPPAGRCALLLAVCASLLAAPVAAMPIYRMIWERTGYGSQYDVSQNTPFEHADSYVIPDGSNAVFTGSAVAFPGQVGIDNHLEHSWASGQVNTSVYKASSFASTTDFLISGPGAWVEGQLHFRARASLSRSGSGQSTRFNVDARARAGALVAMGDLILNNSGTNGTGLLAGITNPDLDFPFVLSGFFPVGTPFDVNIQVFGQENCSATVPAAWARADAGANRIYGLSLEEVDGQVLTMPEGYTLNSQSWRVVDNKFQIITGVGTTPARGEMRLSISPNPVGSISTMSFEQPRASNVRVQVFDLGGRLVRTLADEWRAAGTQRFRWDGRANDGSVAGTGIYFARVEAGSWVATQRIARVR